MGGGVKSTWILLAVLMTTGCFSPVSVQLTPRYDARRSDVGLGRTVALQVIDARGDRTVGRRQHGLVPGSRLELTRPIEDTVRQSIADSLQRKRFTVATGGDASARLSIEVIELRYEPRRVVGTRYLTRAQLRAVATSAGGTYSRTYTQTDEDRALVGSGGHFNAARLSAVLADTMRQMMTDEALIAILAAPSA